jgi:hypothetical protein
MYITCRQRIQLNDGYYYSMRTVLCVFMFTSRCLYFRASSSRGAFEHVISMVTRPISKTGRKRKQM